MMILLVFTPSTSRWPVCIASPLGDLSLVQAVTSTDPASVHPSDSPSPLLPASLCAVLGEWRAGVALSQVSRFSFREPEAFWCNSSVEFPACSAWSFDAFGDADLRPRLAVGPRGSQLLYVLSPRQGLMKLSSAHVMDSTTGSTNDGGFLLAHNPLLAIHGQGQLVFVPFVAHASPSLTPSLPPPSRGQAVRSQGYLLLRSPFAPEMLLVVDPDSLRLTGQRVLLNGPRLSELALFAGPPLGPVAPGVRHLGGEAVNQGAYQFAAQGSRLISDTRLRAGRFYWEIFILYPGISGSPLRVGLVTEAQLADDYKCSGSENWIVGTNWVEGDVIGVSCDFVAGRLQIACNGKLTDHADLVPSDAVFFPALVGSNEAQVCVNWGESAFRHAPAGPEYYSVAQMAARDPNSACGLAARARPLLTMAPSNPLAAAQYSSDWVLLVATLGRELKAGQLGEVGSAAFDTRAEIASPHVIARTGMIDSSALEVKLQPAVRTRLFHALMAGTWTIDTVVSVALDGAATLTLQHRDPPLLYTDAKGNQFAAALRATRGVPAAYTQTMPCSPSTRMALWRRATRARLPMFVDQQPMGSWHLLVTTFASNTVGEFRSSVSKDQKLEEEHFVPSGLHLELENFALSFDLPSTSVSVQPFELFVPLEVNERLEVKEKHEKANDQKSEGFPVGSRLDCLDDAKWRTATVLDRRIRLGSNSDGKNPDIELRVHWDGWGDSYDQWVPVVDGKVAPLGTYTQGRWTGSGRRSPGSDTSLLWHSLSVPWSAPLKPPVTPEWSARIAQLPDRTLYVAVVETLPPDAFEENKLFPASLPPHPQDVTVPSILVPANELLEVKRYLNHMVPALQQNLNDQKIMNVAILALAGDSTLTLADRVSHARKALDNSPDMNEDPAGFYRVVHGLPKRKPVTTECYGYLYRALERIGSTKLSVADPTLPPGCALCGLIEAPNATFGFRAGDVICVTCSRDVYTDSDSRAAEGLLSAMLLARPLFVSQRHQALSPGHEAWDELSLTLIPGETKPSGAEPQANGQGLRPSASRILAVSPRLRQAALLDSSSGGALLRFRPPTWLLSSEAAPAPIVIASASRPPSSQPAPHAITSNDAHIPGAEPCVDMLFLDPHAPQTLFRTSLSHPAAPVPSGFLGETFSTLRACGMLVAALPSRADHVSLPHTAVVDLWTWAARRPRSAADREDSVLLQTQLLRLCATHAPLEHEGKASPALTELLIRRRMQGLNTECPTFVGKAMLWERLYLVDPCDLFVIALATALGSDGEGCGWSCEVTEQEVCEGSFCAWLERLAVSRENEAKLGVSTCNQWRLVDTATSTALLRFLARSESWGLPNNPDDASVIVRTLCTSLSYVLAGALANLNVLSASRLTRPSMNTEKMSEPRELRRDEKHCNSDLRFGGDDAGNLGEQPREPNEIFNALVADAADLLPGVLVRVWHCVAEAALARLRTIVDIPDSLLALRGQMLPACLSAAAVLAPPARGQFRVSRLLRSLCSLLLMFPPLPHYLSTCDLSSLYKEVAEPKLPSAKLFEDQLETGDLRQMLVARLAATSRCCFVAPGRSASHTAARAFLQSLFCLTNNSAGVVDAAGSTLARILTRALREQGGGVNALPAELKSIVTQKELSFCAGLLLLADADLDESSPELCHASEPTGTGKAKELPPRSSSPTEDIKQTILFAQIPNHSPKASSFQRRPLWAVAQVWARKFAAGPLGAELLDSKRRLLTSVHCPPWLTSLVRLTFSHVTKPLVESYHNDSTNSLLAHSLPELKVATPFALTSNALDALVSVVLSCNREPLSVEETNLNPETSLSEGSCKNFGKRRVRPQENLCLPPKRTRLVLDFGGNSLEVKQHSDGTGGNDSDQVRVVPLDVCKGARLESCVWLLRALAELNCCSWSTGSQIPIQNMLIACDLVHEAKEYLFLYGSKQLYISAVTCHADAAREAFADILSAPHSPRSTAHLLCLLQQEGSALLDARSLPSDARVRLTTALLHVLNRCGPGDETGSRVLTLLQLQTITPTLITADPSCLLMMTRRAFSVADTEDAAAGSVRAWQLLQASLTLEAADTRWMGAALSQALPSLIAAARAAAAISPLVLADARVRSLASTPARVFAVGDSVMAHYKKMESSQYEARVMAVNPDGSLALTYLIDLEHVDSVPASFVARVLKNPDQLFASTVQVGSLVAGLCKAGRNSARWLPAIVLSARSGPCGPIYRLRFNMKLPLQDEWLCLHRIGPLKRAGPAPLSELLVLPEAVLARQTDGLAAGPTSTTPTPNPAAAPAALGKPNGNELERLMTQTGFLLAHARGCVLKGRKLTSPPSTLTPAALGLDAARLAELWHLLQCLAQTDGLIDSVLPNISPVNGVMTGVLQQGLELLTNVLPLFPPACFSSAFSFELNDVKTLPLSAEGLLSFCVGLFHFPMRTEPSAGSLSAAASDKPSLFAHPVFESWSTGEGHIATARMNVRTTALQLLRALCRPTSPTSPVNPNDIIVGKSLASPDWPSVLRDALVTMLAAGTALLSTPVASTVMIAGLRQLGVALELLSRAPPPLAPGITVCVSAAFASPWTGLARATADGTGPQWAKGRLAQLVGARLVAEEVEGPVVTGTVQQVDWRARTVRVLLSSEEDANNFTLFPLEHVYARVAESSGPLLLDKAGLLGLLALLDKLLFVPEEYVQEPCVRWHIARLQPQGLQALLGCAWASGSSLSIAEILSDFAPSLKALATRCEGRPIALLRREEALYGELALALLTKPHEATRADFTKCVPHSCLLPSPRGAMPNVLVSVEKIKELVPLSDQAAKYFVAKADGNVDRAGAMAVENLGKPRFQSPTAEDRKIQDNEWQSWLRRQSSAHAAVAAWEAYTPASTVPGSVAALCAQGTEILGAQVNVAATYQLLQALPGKTGFVVDVRMMASSSESKASPSLAVALVQFSHPTGRFGKVNAWIPAKDLTWAGGVSEGCVRLPKLAPREAAAVLGHHAVIAGALVASLASTALSLLDALAWAPPSASPFLAWCDVVNQLATTGGWLDLPSTGMTSVGVNLSKTNVATQTPLPPCAAEFSSLSETAWVRGGRAALLRATVRRVRESFRMMDRNEVATVVQKYLLAAAHNAQARLSVVPKGDEKSELALHDGSTPPLVSAAKLAEDSKCTSPVRTAAKPVSVSNETWQNSRIFIAKSLPALANNTVPILFEIPISSTTISPAVFAMAELIGPADSIAGSDMLFSDPLGLCPLIPTAGGLAPLDAKRTEKPDRTLLARVTLPRRVYLTKTSSEVELRFSTLVRNAPDRDPLSALHALAFWSDVSIELADDFPSSMLSTRRQALRDLVPKLIGHWARFPLFRAPRSAQLEAGAEKVSDKNYMQGRGAWWEGQRVILAEDVSTLGKETKTKGGKPLEGCVVKVELDGKCTVELDDGKLLTQVSTASLRAMPVLDIVTWLALRVTTRLVIAPVSSDDSKAELGQREGGLRTPSTGEVLVMSEAAASCGQVQLRSDSIEMELVPLVTDEKKELEEGFRDAHSLNRAPIGLEHYLGQLRRDVVEAALCALDPVLRHSQSSRACLASCFGFLLELHACSATAGINFDKIEPLQARLGGMPSSTGLLTGSMHEKWALESEGSATDSDDAEMKVAIAQPENKMEVDVSEVAEQVDDEESSQEDDSDSDADLQRAIALSQATSAVATPIAPAHTPSQASACSSVTVNLGEQFNKVLGTPPRVESTPHPVETLLLALLDGLGLRIGGLSVDERRESKIDGVEGLNSEAARLILSCLASPALAGCGPHAHWRGLSALPAAVRSAWFQSHLRDTALPDHQDSQIPLFKFVMEPATDLSRANSPGELQPIFFAFARQVAALPSLASLRSRNTAWRVQLGGAAHEGSEGWPGPFRASVNFICRELRAAAHSGSAHALLVPNANSISQLGEGRGLFVLNPALASDSSLSLHVALGQLLGCCLRSSAVLSLNLDPLFWQQLLLGAGPPGFAADSERVVEGDTADSLFLARLAEMTESEFQLFQQAGLNEALCFTTRLTGGRNKIALLEGGESTAVGYTTCKAYSAMVVTARRRESARQLCAVRAGLWSIIGSSRLSHVALAEGPSLLSRELLLDQGLAESHGTTREGTGMWLDVRAFGPPETITDGVPNILLLSPFALLTAPELEKLVCGVPELDLSTLIAHTRYNAPLSEQHPLIIWLWEVLESFSSSQRTAFLNFVWARPRLPSEGFEQKMSVTLSNQSALHHPTSQTCFFALTLPNYTSKAVLKQKLEEALLCDVINKN